MALRGGRRRSAIIDRADGTIFVIVSATVVAMVAALVAGSKLRPAHELAAGFCGGVEQLDGGLPNTTRVETGEAAFFDLLSRAEAALTAAGIEHVLLFDALHYVHELPRLKGAGGEVSSTAYLPPSQIVIAASSGGGSPGDAFGSPSFRSRLDQAAADHGLRVHEGGSRPVGGKALDPITARMVLLFLCGAAGGGDDGNGSGSAPYVVLTYLRDGGSHVAFGACRVTAHTDLILPPATVSVETGGGGLRVAVPAMPQAWLDLVFGPDARYEDQPTPACAMAAL